MHNKNGPWRPFLLCCYIFSIKQILLFSLLSKHSTGLENITSTVRNECKYWPQYDISS